MFRILPAAALFYLCLAALPAGAASGLRADFDGDGLADDFSALPDDNGNTALVAVLHTGKTLASQPVEDCCAAIRLHGDKIVVESTGMRFFSYYTFRFDRKAGDFRLIGYDSESFGNAANDGQGKSSLNLLNGDYRAAYKTYDEKRQRLQSLPAVTRRIDPGPAIYLRAFGPHVIDRLLMLDHDNLPRQVQ